MKSSTSQYFYSVCRQAYQEFKVIGKQFLEFLKRTPVPRILVFCIAFAIFITLIPLVITLFIIFVLLKLLMLAMASNLKNTKKNPVEDVEIIYPRKRIDNPSNDRY
jgi:hypothetical protein